MTDIELRDYFAGRAIAGVVASLHAGINERSDLADLLSAAAYRLADAMMTERAKGLTSPPSLGDENFINPRTQGLPGSGGRGGW